MQFFDPDSIFRCEILNSYKILNPGLKYHGSEIMTTPPPLCIFLCYWRGISLYYGFKILSFTHIFINSHFIGGGVYYCCEKSPLLPRCISIGEGFQNIDHFPSFKFFLSYMRKGSMAAKYRSLLIFSIPIGEGSNCYSRNILLNHLQFSFANGEGIWSNIIAPKCWTSSFYF